MGTLLRERPPSTPPEGQRVPRDSPTAAVMAKGPQPCIQNFFPLGLGLWIPWLVLLPAPARSFGLFKAHILDAVNPAGLGRTAVEGT